MDNPRTATIGIASSSFSKLISMQGILGRWAIDAKLIQIGQTDEGRDILLNARQKAFRGSQRTCIPVISTDEGIYASSGSYSPGAAIRRRDGRSLTDEEVIRGIEMALLAQGNRTMVLRITTAISIVHRENILSESLAEDLITLRWRPQNERIYRSGRPLDAFHCNEVVQVPHTLCTYLEPRYSVLRKMVMCVLELTY